MSTGYDAPPYALGDDWLRLDRNENVFAEAIWTPARRATLASHLRFTPYPDPACTALRAALAELYGVDRECLYVAAGSDAVLNDLLRWLRRGLDIMRVLPIGYRMYPLFAERYDFTLQHLPAGRTAPAAGTPPAVAVVDSPNAVAGSQVTRAALDAMMTEPRTFVIWDNCYGEFAGDAIAGPPPDRMAIVRSFSKYYGLAGLRVGYCVAAPAVVAALNRSKDPYHVSAIAQGAALDALGTPLDFARARDEMHRVRTRMVAILSGLGFHVLPPSGNFVTVTHPVVSADRLLDALRVERIAARHFPGAGTDQLLRITVPAEVALSRLERALQPVAAMCSVPA